MSWKDNYISEHSEEAYKKRLEQNRAYHKTHKEAKIARVKIWGETHPEQVRANQQEAYRKGGRRYERTLVYNRTYLRCERNKVRGRHQHMWHQYKNIIAPDSQLHHQWQPGTADYDGVALVEPDQHMHGFIDVIQILEGKITVFTEEALRDRGEDVC